jgi:hypothetical protein
MLVTVENPVAALLRTVPAADQSGVRPFQRIKLFGKSSFIHSLM